MKLHFPHPHPTFGTKKKPKSPASWKKSVYYWWWEYLCRSQDYMRTCENGGKGKCAALYKDFGDVFGTDFKTWWTKGDRGAQLFAEPPTPSIRVIDEGIVLSSPNTNSLVLEVPLNLPINFLVKRFREIVSKRHSGKRGVKVSATTQAKYPVTTGRIDVRHLEVALKVWDARQAEPKKPLWKIATELRLSPANNVLSNDSPKIAAAKRNTLTATASRYIRKAEAMIANVGKGEFPKSFCKS